MECGWWRWPGRDGAATREVTVCGDPECGDAECKGAKGLEWARSDFAGGTLPTGTTWRGGEDLSVADFSECLPHPYEISTLRPLEKERTVSTVEA